jgi:response regulator RpfG family c-di-GMP phosphodiesterase
VSKHDGATICFREGGLKYFDPELVDSFVENKNSDIKVICSDLHIFCHNVSVQDMF